MTGRALALTIALAFTAAPAWSQATMVSLENAYEASTLYVSVPESVPTSWTLRPCPTCNQLTLAVDGNSRFFVGKDEVSLAMLRKYAVRGTTNLDVFADPKSKRVTRVILRSELDAADRTRPSVKR